MNTNTDSSAYETPMSHDDIGKTLTGSLSGVDAARVTRFNELGQIRNAKSRSLAREQSLLAQKHGTADHPRIAQARQRFSTNEKFRLEIAVMTELGETPLPDADPNQLIVHGFVRRRSDRVGIPGLTLALTDREGNWLRELGYTCTDQRGYFLLDPMLREGQAGGEVEATAYDIKTDMNVDAAKREAEARREAEAKKAAAAGQTGQGTSDASTDKATYFEPPPVAYLRVFDAKGHVLHTETRPVKLHGGNVDYRTILLGDEAAECGCVPPPTKAGGRPTTKGPTPESPRSPSLPPSATPTTTQPRVIGLKPYEQPDPNEAAQQSQPLEAIRGIGPKSADKLRRAGIKDVGDFERRRGEEFVKLAGFDKAQGKAPSTKPQAASTQAVAQAPTPPSRSAESAPPAKAPKAAAGKQAAAPKAPAKRTKKKGG